MGASRALAITVILVIAACGDNVSVHDGGQTDAGSAIVDPARSTVTVDRASGVIADGQDHATITVVLVDATGTPIADQAVTLAATGDGDVLGQPMVTDATGHAQGTLAATVAGMKTVSATSAGTTLAAMPGVAFVAGAAAKLGFAVQPSSAQAGVAIAPAVQVAVEDAHGNVDTSSTATVSLSGNGPGLLAGTTSVAAVAGIATFANVSATKAGSYTLTASSGGASVISASFTISAAGPDGTRSKLVASPTRVPPDGTSTSTLRVTVEDAYGNPISGAAVSLTASGSNNTFSPATAMGMTDSSGVLIATLASTTAETKSVFADADGIMLSTSVTFTPLVCTGTLLLPAQPVPVITPVSSEVTSVADGDFNGDGYPDLVVVNYLGATVALNKGDGSGTFLPPTSYTTGPNLGPVSVAVGDFNGDGAPDFAVTNAYGYDDSTNYVSVLLNKGDGSGTFLPQVTYATGPRPNSVAVGDFNGDGKPDLVVARGDGYNRVTVLLNKGDGSGAFLPPTSYATGTGPVSVAIGDFNGDGKPDLAVANSSSNSVSVLLNKADGTGTFDLQVTYPAGTAPSSVAVGDFNGDGVPDLAVANASDNTVSVLLDKGDGSGTLLPRAIYPAGTAPSSVAVGDLNGDGVPDLAVANHDDDTVSVLLDKADGSGTFVPQASYPTGLHPKSVAVGDFNGDGVPDLAVANYDDGAVNVLLDKADGSGTFPTSAVYPTASIPSAVVTGDFNGDGIPDLAVANRGANTVSVMLDKGDGSGTFLPPATYATGASPDSVAVGDFNGDGVPDLAVANFGDMVSVLLGKADGSGTFLPAASYPAGIDPVSVAVGDFNGDGTLDLAVANYGAGNVGTSTVSVLLGKADGSGTFLPQTTYMTSTGATAIAVGDFNGDGTPDLAVASYIPPAGVSVLLAKADGSGTFLPSTTYPIGYSPVSVVVGDFNGDGTPDLAIAFQDAVSVMLDKADGTGTFLPQVTVATESGSLAVGDLNGDGVPDLAVAIGNLDTVSVILDKADGTGTFLPQANYQAGLNNYSVTIGDFNGDGRADLAVSGLGATSAEVDVLLDSGCQP